jgi:hypothetical protein
VLLSGEDAAANLFATLFEGVQHLRAGILEGQCLGKNFSGGIDFFSLDFQAVYGLGVKTNVADNGNDHGPKRRRSSRLMEITPAAPIFPDGLSGDASEQQAVYAKKACATECIGSNSLVGKERMKSTEIFYAIIAKSNLTGRKDNQSMKMFDVISFATMVRINYFVFSNGGQQVKW